MANLTTIYTSVSTTTFVVFVGSELGFSLVPRVVTFRVRYDSFAINVVLARNGWLRRTLKVCFHILRVIPMFLTARSTFVSITSKAAGNATNVLVVTDIRMFERWHRYRCLTLIPSSSETSRYWRVNRIRPRHKLFFAASFCRAIKVSYLLVGQLIIKSARRAPTLRPPMYKYAASLTEMSLFQYK
jgi:hypothetical protein